MAKLKSKISAIIKIFLILATTTILYLLYVSTKWFLPETTKQKYRSFIVRSWASSLLKIINIRIDVKGNYSHRTPKLFVSNHLGYLDILVYSAIFGGTFVSKSDVGNWPIIGSLLKTFDIILIDRTSARNSSKIAEPILLNYRDRNMTVTMFPEGTSSNGDDVLPFRSLLFQFFIDHKLPVSYAAISYTVPEGHDAGEEVCWWRPETTLVEHVHNLLQIGHIEAKVVIGEETLTAEDRRSLCTLAHKKVAAIYGQAA